MAFVNEYISEADMQKYQIRDIWEQFHSKSTNDLNVFKKHNWTIDRNRNVFLMQARSGKENISNQVVFILWWKGTYIDVTLADIGGSLDYKNSTGSVRWQLLHIWKTEGFTVPDSHIIPVLKEGLMVYKYAGIRIPINQYRVSFTF